MVLLARLRATHHLLREHMVGRPRSLLLKHTVSAPHLSSIVLASCGRVGPIFTRHHTVLRQDLLRLSDGCLLVLLLLHLVHVLLSGAAVLRLLLAVVSKLLHLHLVLHVRRAHLVHRLLANG